MLTMGKNNPSALKSLNNPLTTSPFKVKEIWGFVRSRPQPIMSPLVNFLSGDATCLGFPPVKFVDIINESEFNLEYFLLVFKD